MRLCLKSPGFCGKIQSKSYKKGYVSMNKTENKADYSAMSEKELLAELLRSQNKSARNSHIAAIAGAVIALVIVIAACVLIPKATAALSKIDGLAAEADALVEQADTVLAQTDAAMEQAEKAMGEVEKAMKDAEKALGQAQDSLDKIDDMVDGVNTVVEQNAKNLTDAMRKLNGIDFDTLNDSIKALYDVLTPIQNFFGIFS